MYIGFKDLEEGLSGKNLVYLESVAKCIHYKASLKDGFQLTDEFTSAVDALQIEDEQELQDYLNLVKRYGTHYVFDVVMGAKSIVQSSFVLNPLKLQIQLLI